MFTRAGFAGRPGWATYLVQHGYVVYVVDRTGHGRSAFHPDVLGPMAPPLSYEVREWLFYSPAAGPAASPVSHLHTQWPGDGSDSDPALPSSRRVAAGLLAGGAGSP